MNKTMLPCVYPKGYFVSGIDVIGKRGTPIKDNKGFYKMPRNKDHPNICVSRYKLIWATQKGLDFRKIPKNYSFWLDAEGNIKCDTFNSRMSEIVSIAKKQTKVKREDYVLAEQFAHLAIQMIDGDPAAKARLFALINSKRDWFVSYARRAKGGVSQEKAEQYTDEAISYTYDLVCSGRYYVKSFIGSVKGKINSLIVNNRRKRSLFDNEI